MRRGAYGAAVLITAMALLAVLAADAGLEPVLPQLLVLAIVGAHL
ncbi:MAG TPA: hypothetical protein VIL95_01790 [Bacillota bacterium]